MNTESTPTPENFDPLAIIEARIAHDRAKRKEKEEAENLAEQERNMVNAAMVPEIVDQLVLELGDLHMLYLESDPGFEQAYPIEVVDHDAASLQPDIPSDPVKPVKRSWLDRLLWIKPPAEAPVRKKRISILDQPYKKAPCWHGAYVARVPDKTRSIFIYIEVETGTLYCTPLDYNIGFYPDVLDPALLKQALTFDEVFALLKRVQSTARFLRNTIRWAKEDAERKASHREQTGTAG